MKKTYLEDIGVKFRFMWSHKLFNEKLVFCGFLDIWTGEKYDYYGERDGIK